jgi:hypothetical protein
MNWFSAVFVLVVMLVASNAFINFTSDIVADSGATESLTKVDGGSYSIEDLNSALIRMQTEDSNFLSSSPLTDITTFFSGSFNAATTTLNMLFNMGSGWGNLISVVLAPLDNPACTTNCLSDRVGVLFGGILIIFLIFGASMLLITVIRGVQTS